MREARTASALNHPNICTIYEIDEYEGAPFIAMELSKGETLEHRHRRAAASASMQSCIDSRTQIADALDAAHAQRHRAPRHQAGEHLRHATRAGEGARLRAGQARETRDARQRRACGRRRDGNADELLSTRAGVALGTIAYMSPEQARGEISTPARSVFVRTRPLRDGDRAAAFQGSTSAVIFDAILNREPAAPIELNANVPAAARTNHREGFSTRTRKVATTARSTCEPICSRSNSNAARRRWAARGPCRTRCRHHRVAVRIGHQRRAGRPRQRLPAVASAPRLFWSVSSESLRWWRHRGCSFRRGTDRRRRRHQSFRSRTHRQRSRLPLRQMRPAAAPQSPTPPAPALAPPATPPSAAGTDSRRAASATPAPAAITAAPPAATPPAAPPAAAGDSLAEPIKIARAKADAKLFDQAVADLRAGLAASPSSPSAPSAHLLLGNILQQQGRPEDAMAAYVELRSRHERGRTPEAAEGTFLLADLVLQSKRNDREETARQLFTAIPSMTGSAPWAVQALLRRATLEDRARARVVDSVLGLTVPASLVSYRQVVESYPDAAGVEPALARLGEMYEKIYAATTWLARHGSISRASFRQTRAMRPGARASCSRSASRIRSACAKPTAWSRRVHRTTGTRRRNCSPSKTGGRP